MKVQNQYALNEATMAFKYARVMHYESIIYDVKGTYYSTQTNYSLINEACLERNTTFEAKKKISAVKYNHKVKPPIIICAFNGIYFIPTMSPTSIDTIWINPRHVISVSEDPMPTLTFVNGETLEINCSKHTYDKQVERAQVQLYHHIPPILWQFLRNRPLDIR
ncbi:competence protein ComK [Bacillus sp. AGMB 02131]|uniref:Competence protein ComK n=1 Tax=Peribacillus faecalis TaxID=2772559 RepID=A0A927HAY9_9BACI|nr:competence protein ComK [Peribacillus faecalis]MBD3107931.1 competence protein ComK [Peribacillus faecalis]